MTYEKIRNRLFAALALVAIVLLLGTLGIRSLENLDILECAAMLIASLRGPWVLCGDFNLTPEVLRASGWVNHVQGRIVAPKRPTCNDSNLEKKVGH